MAEAGRDIPVGRAETGADEPHLGPTQSGRAADLGFSALEAKTRTPLTRLRTVRRDGVIGRLAAVSRDVPMILMVAPTGYGKTTALSQWARDSDRPFAWVHLDDEDNDPMRLLRKVALALHRTQPLDDTVWRALVAREYAAVDVAMPRLVTFLRAHGAATVLVLDDLHQIRTSAALDVVMTLAMSVPRGCTLVAVSRRRPRMRLGRLLSQGGYVEFGPADLAFTADEARVLLGRIGVDLTAETAAALVRTTEGWPAGLHLAGLSLLGKPDPAGAAGEVGGGNRLIMDYFLDEVLAGQSAETVRFLMRTSALDRMSGALCDAVLGTTGSAAWLSEIDALNLFLVPLDEHGEWFRYHRLFGEVLLTELHRREPGEEVRIRRLASAWFERHGPPEQAITHAITGQDPASAARLITAHTPAFTNAGRIAQVRRWLDRLGESALEEYPPLAVTGVWVWALTGDAPRAQRSLRIAESGTYQGRLPDGSAGMASALARAQAALAPHGVERMLVDAGVAVHLEPPGSPWHPLALMLYGVASLLNGSTEAAVKAFEQAARLGREGQRPSASFALAQRSLIAADHGDWATAAACAEEARELMDAARLRNFMPSVLSFAACARVHLHQGDVAAAGVRVDNALGLYRRPSPAAFPWLAAQSALVLGRILLDLGDHAGAQFKAMEAERHIASLPTEGVLSALHREFVADLDHARERSHALDVTDLTRAELRILQQLPTHHSLNEIAHDLFISRNTVKSQVASIYRKLNVANRTEAVREGRETGLLDR